MNFGAVNACRRRCRRMKTRTTSDQKAEALRLVAEVGVSEAARRTGVAKGTISAWCTRAGVHSPDSEALRPAIEAKQRQWVTAKLELGEKLGALALKAAHRIEQRIDSDHLTGMRDLSVTMGIMIDKAQLLTGAATTRTEVVERTADHEAEVAAILRKVA